MTDLFPEISIMSSFISRHPAGTGVAIQISFTLLVINSVTSEIAAIVQ